MQAWPRIELGLDAFLAWAERVPEVLALDKVKPADLVLAAGCVVEAEGAARAFIEGPLREALVSIQRFLPDPEAQAEALQDLAVHLLTPGPSDGDSPRLGHYDGRAPLRAWIRMVATRRAMREAKVAKRTVSYDAAAFDRPDDHDPETSALRRMHSREIGAIFREAIEGVPAEDRTLLRLYYIEGATLAALAALHRTSRSSLHRRIEASRVILFERIGALVRERLRLTGSQQGSMLRIFESDLRDALGAFLLRR